MLIINFTFKFYVRIYTHKRFTKLQNNDDNMFRMFDEWCQNQLETEQLCMEKLCLVITKISG